MPRAIQTVALFVANPALSAILGIVLAAAPTLRVRPFESRHALATYMQLAPVDLLVCDLDGLDAPPGEIIAPLRRDALREQRSLQVIGLSGRLTADVKLASIRAGIDEIIVKPASPKYLLERVLSRLSRPAGPHVAVPSRHAATPIELGDNVIPLFGRQPQLLH